MRRLYLCMLVVIAITLTGCGSYVKVKVNGRDISELEKEDVSQEKEDVSQENNQREIIYDLIPVEEIGNSTESDDSTSSYDIDNYLDSDGMLPDEWYEVMNEHGDYNGLWEYPELNSCRFFNDVRLFTEDDTKCVYICKDTETGYKMEVSLHGGRYKYSLMRYIMEPTFIVDTQFGPTDVLYAVYEDCDTGYDDGIRFTKYSYMYLLGNYTITFDWDDFDEYGPLTQDDLQLIADNILYVGEPKEENVDDLDNNTIDTDKESSSSFNQSSDEMSKSSIYANIRDNYDAFGDVSNVYGVYSKSSYDLDKYLDEDGRLIHTYAAEGENTQLYSGRWAYPTLLKCDHFDKLALKNISDISCEYTAFNTAGDREIAIYLVSGLENYLNLSEYKPTFTVDTEYGKTGVYITSGRAEFNIGNFYVLVENNSDKELTDEDICTIVDNIVYVGDNNGIDATPAMSPRIVVSDEVIKDDASEVYDVYSELSSDVDKYLDSNNELSEDSLYSEEGEVMYTGRWTYPTITECRYLYDMFLKDRTDKECTYSTRDKVTSNNYTVIIKSGLHAYNACSEEPAYTIDTKFGESNVYINRFQTFKIGNFTVSLFRGDGSKFTKDEVQLIADNINYAE